MREVLQLTVLLCFCASAQPLHTASFLFRNATIHPASSPVLKNADLLIEAGTISAVGPNLSAGEATVIDAQGKHLYPGLIAAGTIAGLVEIDAARPTRDFAEVGEYTPEVRSWTAINPDSDLLPVARANGITHILPVPSGGVVSGQSAVVALAGWTVEEMVVQAPAALHVFWPSMSLDLTPRDALRDKSKFKSLEEQAKERKQNLRELDDFFSEAEAYARARKLDKTAKVPAWEAMLPFLSGDRPLVIHADDVRQIKAAIDWVAQRKYRACIAGGKDAWRLADLLVKHEIPVLYERTYYMSSSLAATPRQDVDPYDIHFSAPSVLHKAGVKIAIGLGLGGHSSSELRNLPYHAAQAVAFGLPEDVALRSLTLHPAELLGVADRLGSLEPGKEATLLVTNGDLFDIRTVVEQVWIGGVKSSLDTRHTRLYQKYNNRPRPE